MKRVSIAILLFLCMLVAETSYSWTWRGYYWSEKKAGFNFIGNGYNNTWKSICRKAVLSWSNAGTDFFFFEDAWAPSGFNRIDLGDPNPINGDVILGITTPNWRPDNTIIDMHTSITNNKKVQWSTKNVCPADKYDVETVILHELGHWLELTHSSSHSEAVMFPDIYKGQKKILSQDDSLGIKYIYPKIDSVKLCDSIPPYWGHQSDPFYEGTVYFLWENGTYVVLAGSPDGLSRWWVDDIITLTVTHIANNTTVNWACTSLAVKQLPIDVSGLFLHGSKNQIEVELANHPNHVNMVGCSELWLVSTNSTKAMPWYSVNQIASRDSIGTKEELVSAAKVNCYPNPMVKSCNISYNLSKDAKVDAGIYNIAGQLVRSLVSDILPAGKHTIVWDGTDDECKQVSRGIYFTRIKSEGFTETHKIIVVR